jgi:hypothetical protein
MTASADTTWRWKRGKVSCASKEQPTKFPSLDKKTPLHDEVALVFDIPISGASLAHLSGANRGDPANGRAGCTIHLDNQSVLPVISDNIRVPGGDVFRQDRFGG